jgi:hypothetical protein
VFHLKYSIYGWIAFLGDDGMRKYFGNIASLIFICSFSSGCGNSLWTVARGEAEPSELDGAILSYALAKGEVVFSADFTSNKLVLTSDQKVVAAADHKQMFRLVYEHNAFAADEIDIQMEGALVKSLSSTTEDRSIAAVQGVTALLTQVAATQKDIAKMNTFLSEKVAETPTCPDFKAIHRKDVTNGGSGRTSYTQIGDPNCTVKFDVTAEFNQGSVLEVAGFTARPTTADNLSMFCRYAFCFRKAANFTLKATAILMKNGTATGITAGPLIFDVFAPSQALGYVRFNRRAFVKNKTVVTFTNGIVSGFSASNPSEVVGALQLPTELLKGVSAAIVIH